MWYKVTIKDNIITFENLSGEQVFATIYIANSCDETQFIKVKDKFEIVTTKDVKFPLKDGLYKIVMERVSGGTIVETSEIVFPYFNILLESIITEMEYFLCGCGCEECDDCVQDEKTGLSVLLKSFSYYALLYKYYFRFYDAVFKCMNCSILDVNSCVLMNEKVIGNSDKEDLLKKILSSFYLAFYFAQWYGASDKLEIDKKFKYNKIIKCIKANNTDIECIKNNINNNMGLFSIEFGAYINQPPSEVGDYFSLATNRAVLTLTPGMFTNLTTPPYADPEGDAAQAIRVDTLPTNSATLTYNNNPVTVGQIITIADIASNMLKLTGPNQNALATCTFNFSVRDVGSMQFTS